MKGKEFIPETITAYLNLIIVRMSARECLEHPWLQDEDIYVDMLQVMMMMIIMMIIIMIFPIKCRSLKLSGCGDVWREEDGTEL